MGRGERVVTPRPVGKPGRQAALGVVALAASSVAIGHGFGRLTYPFVLPAMVDDVVGSYGRAGLLGTANLGAYLAGLLVMIALSGRVALHQFLRVGLAGVTAGLVLLAVAPSYGALLVAMVLAGGFNAAIWVPASALAANAVPEHRRGLAVGALGMGYGLAIVLAGRLTRVVESVAGERAWRPVWAVAAALGAVTLATVVLGLRPQPVVRRPGGGLRLATLRGLPGGYALTASYAAFALGYVIYTNYLVAALEDDAGFSAGHAAAAYSVLGFAGIVGGLLVGRVSDRLGRRTVLVGAHALMAACAGATLVGAEPWVTLSAAIFGVFASGLPAVVAAYVADHLEPAAVAGAFGVVTVAFAVSQTVGPPLGGALADATGAFTLTFCVSLAAHAGGALAAAALPRRRRPAPAALPAEAMPTP